MEHDNSGDGRFLTGAVAGRSSRLAAVVGIVIGLGTMAGGAHFELFDGVLRENPGKTLRRGYVGAEIAGRFYIYAKPHRYGTFFSAETQFTLSRNPDTVVKPDVSFIRMERMPPPAEHDRIARIPPDFAVEVVSPGDRKAVTVYALGQTPVVLGVHDVLDGGEVFPGFTLPVAEIFA